MDINKIQKEIDETNELDDYSMYERVVPNNYKYKLTREEFENLNLSNTRETTETKDEYKLRRKKIEHYLDIKSARLYYPTHVLGTYRKNSVEEQVKDLYEKYRTKKVD